MRFRFLAPLLAVLPLASGCNAISGAPTPGPGPDVCGGLARTSDDAEPRGIQGFGSEAELSSYVGDIEAASAAEQAQISECYARNPPPTASGESASSMGDSAGTASAPTAPEPPSNENVTNNQESGVDEGGIVKNVGGSLVVLRQGRLFVVDVGEGRAPTLVDSMRVARTEALNSGVWYDEMLVKGDLVYVVGYRYGVASASGDVRGATEIDTFRLANGKLQRLGSTFLESNDYYSGKNYASRMTGGRLVFYMPHYVGRKDAALVYPRLLEMGDDGVARAKGPLFGALDVSTSLVKPRSAAFHTVVQCDLPETGELACRAKSVLGSWWREHYVSGDAVYLWASSHVYRFDFATLDVTVHRAEGYPVDQFAFRAAQEELLVATTRPANPNDPKNLGTYPALLRLPRAAFDKKGAQAELPSVKLADTGRIAKNRFVGDVLVAGVEAASGVGGYGWSDQATGELVAHDTATGLTARRPVTNLVRLEPLGSERVLAVTQSTDYKNLALESFGTKDLGAPLGRVDIQGAQGESRSHGFFFKPGEGGGGVFGYAVVNPRGYGASYGYGNGVSNLGFFRVGGAGSIDALGIVSAGNVNATCETSCTDWYGNTRPVFLGARTFALMGSELAEVIVDGGVRRGATAELR